MKRVLASGAVLAFAIGVVRAAAGAVCLNDSLLGVLAGPAYQVVVEDFDRDGVPDFATGSGSGVRILRGFQSDALVEFGSPYDIATGPTPRGFTSADFNRDGIPDLAIVVDNSDQLLVYAGAGNGSQWSMDSVATYLTGARPVSVAAGDLNGDGLLDLVVSNANEGSISVFVGHGNGTFAARSDYAAGGSAYEVRLADVNRDGLLDAVVANPTRSGVSVMHNNGGSGVGANVFRAALVHSVGTGRQPRALRLSDFDGDGVLDCVLAHTTTAGISVMTGRITSNTYRLGPATDYDASGTVLAGDTFRSLTVSDWNQDGIFDIAAVFPRGRLLAPGQTVGIYYSDGAFNFQAATGYIGPEVATATEAADLNGDGGPDLIAVGQGGTYRVYWSACAAAPAVTAFSPDAGAVGDTVVVQGTALAPVTLVRFGGVEAEIVTRSVLTLTVRVPPGASTGPITVESPHGTASSATSFVVGEKPQLSRVEPDRAKAGRTIEVFGAFLTETEEVRLGAGPPASFEVLSDSVVRVAVDTLARSGLISVRTRFGHAVSDFTFTVLPPDTVARIESVRDVPDDEGGRVIVEWLSSDLDVPGRGLILGYRVMRREFIPLPSPASVARTLRPGVNDEIWRTVASVPATFLSRYSAIAPTASDSTADGAPFYTFRVDAFTSDSNLTFVSDTASGYSVDNRPPPAPAEVSARYDLDDVELTWTASPAADFASYAVYRGSQPGFLLDSAHLIAIVLEPRYRDRPGYGAFWYRIVARDVHGNRGVSPEIAVGAPPLPERLELARLGPNPAPGPLSLVLALPVAGTVQLEVIDIAGRRVLESSPAFADPGIQRLTWKEVGGLAPGVYFLRVRQENDAVTRRFVVSR